jgi:magnesium transporter
LLNLRLLDYDNCMLTAFVQLPDGTCRNLDTVETVSEVSEREGTKVWVDLESPAEEELKAIGSTFKLDGEALDDCLRGEQRPRIDEFDDHIFLVVYGLLGAEEGGEFEPRKLAAFCSSRFLITIHGDPLRTVREVRERCRRHPGRLLGRGVDFILFCILDGMVDKYMVVADAYEARLDELEEGSLDPSVDESILAEVSALRRDLLELRRITESQMELIAPLVNGEYDFISDSLEPRFRHVRDHLATVLEMVESQRELLNGVRENYHTALANRMNTVMKTLTVFASILLPLSLIAGIYGMNLRLWPQADSPLGFWGVLALMGILAGVLLVYFRRQKWL